MKRLIFFIITLFAILNETHAQKFLDIYRNSKIVSSVKASNVDSLVACMDNGKRTLDFYQDGEVFHHTLAANIDSIKIHNIKNDPLVWLGIVGFNQELYEKSFSVLDKTKTSEFTNFVNGLTRKDGTLLYYGVDQALDMLRDTPFNTQISSVNLITFTDGLDQGSLMMTDRYTTDEQYLAALNDRINSMSVEGLPLTAYSLGLRGNDVSNYTLFQSNLTQLASSPDKAFEVSNMSAVRSRLQEISNQIISVSTKQTISMKIPGQSDGTIIRFTFNGSSATNSSMYIEGTFNLSDRSLRNVTYYGLTSESGNIVQGVQSGIFVTYTFTGLRRTDGSGLIPTNNIRQYYKSATATTWQENSEFSPANNTQTTVNHSGAVIMLVLDSSSSLGSQFSDMQNYANDFIDNVANNAAVVRERPFGNLPQGEVIAYNVNGVEFNMVNVVGGTFMMGDDWRSKPIHQVTLSDYSIGETEVTQELWYAVMGGNPSYSSGSGQLPMERLTWYDCQEFITKLNELTGKTFRLPTEAEWEYAARGGIMSNGYRYSGSNNIDDVAWYEENSNRITHVVKEKMPNELGLYDMSGNVIEYCQDWFGDYTSSAVVNPTGPLSGTHCVTRGGGCINMEGVCTVSARFGDFKYTIKGLNGEHYGFRLAQ